MAFGDVRGGVNQYFLDLAAINAHILYKQCVNITISRGKFILELVKELCAHQKVAKAAGAIACKRPFPETPSPPAKRRQCQIGRCSGNKTCYICQTYHREMFTYAVLNKKHENVTAMLKVQVHKATELKSHLDEVQESYKTMLKQLDSLKEKERFYGVLKGKYQRIQELLITRNASENCGICEEGWKALGLKCYYFSMEKLNWTQSRDYCVKNGSLLVIITAQTEQDFVSSHIKETHWIGLNDLETEGKWMWVNDQPLNNTGVMFWYSKSPKQPDNWEKQDPSGENCAALGDANGNTHTWFDASCHTLKKWICEK